MGQRVVNIGYHHYLTTAAWRRKRLERLEIDGHRCARCKSEDGLQVHHVHYDTVWQENPETDLVTLCRACHMREHGKDPSLPGQVSDKTAAERFWDYQAMLYEQENIAIEAGIDLQPYIDKALRVHSWH